MLKRFGLGFGIGYVLGARAGEKRYAQLGSAGQRLAQAPVVKDLVERAPKVARDTFDHLMEAVKDRASFTGTGEGRPSDEDGGPRSPAEDRTAGEEDDQGFATDEQERDDGPGADEPEEDEGADTGERVARSAPTGTRRRSDARSATGRDGRPSAKGQSDGQSAEGGTGGSKEPEQRRHRSLVSSVAELASAAAERGRVA